MCQDPLARQALYPFPFAWDERLPQAVRPVDDGPVVAHDHEFLHSERASVLSLRCAVIARGRKPVRGAESHEGNLGGRHSPLAHASFEHLVYGGLGGFGGKSCAGFRIVLAAPPVRHDSQRFLEARGLYHSLFSCASRGRLVPDAFTLHHRPCGQVRLRLQEKGGVPYAPGGAQGDCVPGGGVKDDTFTFKQGPVFTNIYGWMVTRAGVREEEPFSPVSDGLYWHCE